MDLSRTDAPEQRQTATVAEHLLRGAAFHSRVSRLRLSGVRLPPSCAEYRLPPPADSPPGVLQGFTDCELGFRRVISSLGDTRR